MSYRIVCTPDYTPSQWALAPRFSTIENAVADMGDGLVIGEDGHLAAFHERHLALLTRRAAR